jgi:hypothetical protein
MAVVFLKAFIVGFGTSVTKRREVLDPTEVLVLRGGVVE